MAMINNAIHERENEGEPSERTNEFEESSRTKHLDD